MPCRRLDGEELKKAAKFLKSIRVKLESLSGRDPNLLFAYRRKICRELKSDEGGKFAERKLLRAQKLILQHFKCANPKCRKDLRTVEAEMHRFDAPLGYTLENTQVLCRNCHRKQQAARAFA